ncbi:Metaxin-1 [Auxenochlorella protothecoides]|uniref:Metaxin-1 n=1 Tax=Auxenochlorella protothecoides TaxID=3075 RepID=A0A087SAC2_AUXPR|nr:Metaxin-1 [Auxenochlorella protothecoides]KFM22676.1 Metaxin-1 [Auxenochlorella protothecoides]
MATGTPFLILYKAPSAWGLPSLSISSIQIEAYLQLAGISYTVRECSSDSQSPTGRLPALEAGPTLVGLAPVKCPYTPAEEEAAAGALLSYLRESVRDLDQGLKGGAKGEAVAFRSLLQTSLLPALVYSAWSELEAYSNHMQPAVGAQLPFPLSYITPAMHRRAVRQAFRTTGEQVYATAAAALDAFAAKLAGGEGYLLGSSPSTIDAQLYGCLTYLRSAPVVHPQLHRHFLGQRELVAYTVRVGEALAGLEVPLPRSDPGAAGPSWSEWSWGGSTSRASKEASALSAELNRKGKIWVGCAAAVIVAYVVFGGQYFQFGFLDDEDDDLDGDYE